MSRRPKKVEPPASRSVRLEPVTNIRAVRGFNVGKGVASTSISITADVAPATADIALELAAEGAPLFLNLGTDQRPLPFEGAATPAQGDPSAAKPAADPEPSATPDPGGDPEPEE